MTTAIFLSLLTVGGCRLQSSSMGIEGSILFVVDSLDRPIVRRVFEDRFGRIISTPQPEPQFSLHWADGATLADRSASPLILLAATTDGAGATAQLLRRMLTPQVESGVESGDYALFRKEDVWAKPQLLLILVGRNRRELGLNATEWTDSLYRWAFEFEMKRVTDQLFRRGEQTELERGIHEKYGFRLRIQHDYVIAQENDTLSFVRLIRHFPERWITVAWGSLADIDSARATETPSRSGRHSTLKPVAGEELERRITPRFLFERRRALGDAFLDPVTLYNDRWTQRMDTLAGRRVVRIEGLWATVGPAGGGPFVIYGIELPESNRYYLVDGAVFAPGKTKMPYLWQIEAILHTFLPD